MMLRSLFSFQTEAAMKAEIIALRHQVLVWEREREKPKDEASHPFKNGP